MKGRDQFCPTKCLIWIEVLKIHQAEAEKQTEKRNHEINEKMPFRALRVYKYRNYFIKKTLPTVSSQTGLSSTDYV